MRDAQERFWEKVRKDCWIWTARRTLGNYGVFRLGNKNRFAHRVAYEWAHGPIPDGLTCDHLCRNPPCVNPDHIELVPIGENIRRSRSANRTKTHCAHGHKFTPSNTIMSTWKGQKVHRKCRTCANERAVVHHRRLFEGLRVRTPKVTHNSVKTHCPHGHEYTPENTYKNPVTDGRICRTCKREGSRQYKAQFKSKLINR